MQVRDAQFYQQILDNLFEGVYFVDRQRRITYWNSGAAHLTGYSAEEMVGARCPDNILMHMDDTGKCLCQNGCPLVQSMDQDRPVEAEAYMRHRDGERLPVRIRVSPVHDAQGQVVGAVESFRDNSAALQMRQQMQELERMALLDPLTSLGNRRYLEDALQARQSELQRHNWLYGVLLMDIDHFKQVNDTHGHQVGDQVLQMVARTLLANLRTYDVVGRWGGEEFMSISRCADYQELNVIAERFRVTVERSTLRLQTPQATEVSVTISVGGILVDQHADPEQALHLADHHLYRGKDSGRNRVVLGGPNLEAS